MIGDPQDNTWNWTFREPEGTQPAPQSAIIDRVVRDSRIRSMIFDQNGLLREVHFYPLPGPRPTDL